MITTTEEECYLRFILLLLRGGSKVLRCIAEKALQRNNLTLDQLLTVNRSSLQKTKKLNPIQKGLLYPASPKTPDLEDFDITLLSYLIHTFLIGSLNSSEIEAVEKIREWRNEYYAHASAPKMPLFVFVREWNRLENIILLVSQDLPEEKKNTMLDTIVSAEKEQVDLNIVLEEIKKLDRSNDFLQVIEQQKETLDQIKKLFNMVSEMKMLLEGKRVIQDDKTARGKVQVNAEDSDTVRNAEDLLLKASEDRIEDSTSEEVIAVKKEVDKLKDDLKERDVKVTSISEGSVIFEFQCFSLTAFLKLVDYFNSYEFQARLAEIGNALEHVVGKKITVSGTLDKSFQDVIQIIQQLEQDKEVRFEMACNCIGSLLNAFEIFKEGADSNSLIESSTLQPESVTKPVILQTSADICQIQQAIKSIKEFLDTQQTVNADSELCTIISNPTPRSKSEPHCHIAGENSTDITKDKDAEDTLKTQHTIASDLKASEVHASLVQTSDQTAESSEMSTGKRKMKFSETLGLGSDEICEYQCSACAKDGKIIDAVKYCVVCNKNLCSTCTVYHNRLLDEINHLITDFLSCEAGEEKPGMPIQKCDKHVEKLVNVYCSDHDVVGCAICVALDHRCYPTSLRKFQHCASLFT